MPAITVAMRTEISQLYVSLFGRAPDGEGLGFWVKSYSDGNTLAKIAQSMYETAPARAYYHCLQPPLKLLQLSTQTSWAGLPMQKAWLSGLKNTTHLPLKAHSSKS